MAHLTVPRPRQLAGPAAEQPAEGVFWSVAIGAAISALPELAARTDLLAERVAQLPLCSVLTRPVVGQYLSMVKTLASAWPLHSRPALVAALEGLLHAGASVGQSFALEAMAAGCADQGRAALRVADALQRRLAAPAAAFAALGAEFAGYLAQMGRITAELEADTRLVTERLQADQVHVFLLSQQASHLQATLDEAALLAQTDWLASPNQAAQRLQAGAQDAAFAQLQARLAQLRAGQGATQAEADYLQGLLPAVAPYLAAVGQIGQRIGVIVDAMQALETGLADLKRAPGDGMAARQRASLQLQAALPYWQALAATAARLQPGAAGVTTPGAIRT